MMRHPVPQRHIQYNHVLARRHAEPEPEPEPYPTPLCTDFSPQERRGASGHI